MNESVLIGKTEKFLDRVRRKKIDTDTIHDLDSYMNIYKYLKDNLDELQDYRDTMEIKGYTAPYRNLMKFGRISTGEMKVEDLHDITRHTQYFRMKAALKKNILDRVKSSIASHKIALGHLEEYAIIKCNDCERDYRGHEIAELIDKKCICGSHNLILQVNRLSVHRIEIIKYLPLSGEYMVKISELTIQGREAFRKIVRMLKQEKRGVVKTVSLVVRVFENGRWVRKRVNTDCTEENNCERMIRRKYGNNARIEYLQFHRKKPSIINDKHVQNALAIGYVQYIEEKASFIVPNILKEKIKNPVILDRYDKIQANARKTSHSIAGEYDDEKQLEQELLSDELTKEGLMISNSLDKELEIDIQVRNDIKGEIYEDAPRVLILWDLVKYYLGTSFDRRSKYSGPFPNMRPVLDKNQLKTFASDYPRSLVNYLQEYLSENIEYIRALDELLNQKFEIEQRFKGLHLKLNPPAVGAVIMHITGGLSLEESARIFNLTINEVKDTSDEIETYRKPVTSKAQKFLEIIKQ